MKMKRSAVLTLCILLCLALSLGGTIAYLTDTDGDVNVMTLGRVEIALEEYQRGDGGLEPYEDDRMLHPLVGEVEARDDAGLPTNVNFHDKIVRVAAKSTNANAYLRVWVGVPSALLDVTGPGEDAVHLVWAEGVTVAGEGIAPATVEGWPWRYLREEETAIEGVPYTMFCYAYTRLLAPGDITPPVLAGLYLDSRVDSNGSGYTYKGEALHADFSGGLQIPVLAQAVQADGFPDAATAFAAAGMDEDRFDEYLDLKTNPISEIMQRLIAAVKVAIDQVSGEEPCMADVASGVYDLTDASAGELNAMTAAAGVQEVHLRVEDGDDVTVNLLNNETGLEENILIVNDGGNLVIQ